MPRITKISRNQYFVIFWASAAFLFSAAITLRLTGQLSGLFSVLSLHLKVAGTCGLLAAGQIKKIHEQTPN